MIGGVSVPDSEQELRRLEGELRAVIKTRMDLERGWRTRTRCGRRPAGRIETVTR